jgi:hypothetical protein
VHDYSIRAEKLARYVGDDSPVVVYPFGRICVSELFRHVFQSTNQPHLNTFSELANLLNCPHSKKPSFGIYLPRFSIAQINSISHTPTERPDFTVALRKIRSFSKSLLFNLFRHRNSTHGIKIARTPPLQHVLPAVTVPNTKGWFSTYFGYTSEASKLRGVVLAHLTLLT